MARVVIPLTQQRGVMSAISNLVHHLTAILEKGIKCDSWGQRLEAAKEYRKFVSEYENGMVNFGSSDANEKQIAAIIKNVQHRARQLTSTQLSMSVNDVTMDQIKSDAVVLKEILQQFQSTLNKRHASVVEDCGENYLLPSPMKTSGMTYLTIRIDKIGLKDAHAYVDPFVRVTVKDRMGTDLAPVQHTPSSYHIQGQHVIFDVNVHIPVPIDDLRNLCQDFAVFFEFKHYKEKEDKVSVRCYAFVEPEELKPGNCVVELYKKPTDFGRKKLYLFTEKPLYLHLELKLQRS